MSGFANEQAVAGASSSSGHSEHTPSTTPSVQMTSPGHPGGGPAGQAPVASGIVGHGIQLKSSMTGAAVPSGIVGNGIQLRPSAGTEAGTAVPSGIVAHDSMAHVAVGSGVQAFHDGPRGVQAKKDKVSGEGSSSAPKVSFEDINEFEQLYVNEAIDLAKALAARALQDLSAAKTHPQDKARRYFKITGDGSRDDRKAIDKAIGVFNQVASKLNREMTFKRGVPREDGEGGYLRAYVYKRLSSFTLRLFGDTDSAVYIVFPHFINEPVQERAVILIHELSHRYGDTNDIAYLHETGKWQAMSRDQAINNADSYGYYAAAAS